MSSELTNLLPPERERGFRKEYFLRLATVAFALLALLVAAHAALLFPSYLYLADQASTARDRLAELDASLASSGEAAMNARLVGLKSEAERLNALASSTSATAALSSVLGVDRSGVTITSLSYHAPAPDGRMTVSGIASTRESLRRFDLALEALPGVVSADLPLSAYAAESNIPFTITLTGRFSP